MYCVHKKARTMHHKNGLLQKYCFDTNLLEDKNFFMNILPRGSSAHLVLDSITGSTLFFIYSIIIVTFTSNCLRMSGHPMFFMKCAVCNRGLKSLRTLVFYFTIQYSASKFQGRCRLYEDLVSKSLTRLTAGLTDIIIYIVFGFNLHIHIKFCLDVSLYFHHRH